MNLNYNIFLLLILTILISCGDENALKEKTFYIKAQNKEWFGTDLQNSTFEMIDNNGISISYKNIQTANYFTESSSQFINLTLERCFYEYFYKNCNSTFNQTFSIGLQANDLPFGDQLSISLNGLTFYYDFYRNELINISFDTISINRIYFDDNSDKDLIKSTVEFIEDYSVNGQIHPQVLHFELKDFANTKNMYKPTEIFYAKKTGLIKYVLADTLTFIRI